MRFNDFLESIPKIKKNPLPGEEAQLLLSPLERPKFSIDYKKNTTREAAVLALLYPKREITHIALIVRTTYDGAHSGQVAMPGGKAEIEDVSLAATAIRETEEEIGISQDRITLVKELTSVYVPTSDFRVYPFLAKADKIKDFKLQESEVADIIEMPVSQLISENNFTKTLVTISEYKSVEVPAFIYKDYIIWGATAMILSELKQLLIESVGL